MNRNLLWRGLLILAVVVGAVLLAYPINKKIHLGLDLKGGIHLVMQVRTEDALRAETESDMARVLARAQEEKITGVTGRRLGDSSFEIAAPSSDILARLEAFVSRERWTSAARDGKLVFSMNQVAISDVRHSAVTQAKQTI